MSVSSKGNNSLMIAEMSDKTEVQISFCFNTQYLAHNLYVTTSCTSLSSLDDHFQFIFCYASPQQHLLSHSYAYLESAAWRPS